MGGFAAFVREQQSVPGRCRLSLAQFDDTYERVYAAVDIRDVPPLDLQPRGSTALHDAMVRLIGEAGAELAALPEEQRPGTVLVAVLTDGHENSSREATGAMVKALVERQQSQWGWQFTYLGANQDAVLTAQRARHPGRGRADVRRGQRGRGLLRPVRQDPAAAGGPDRRAPAWRTLPPRRPTPRRSGGGRGSGPGVLSRRRQRTQTAAGAFRGKGAGRRRTAAAPAEPAAGRGCQALCGGRVMDMTSRAVSSCSSVSSPRSRKPIATTVSRMVRPSATAFLAILAAFS